MVKKVLSHHFCIGGFSKEKIDLQFYLKIKVGDMVFVLHVSIEYLSMDLL